MMPGPAELRRFLTAPFIACVIAPPFNINFYALATADEPA
jgi:hypothetical protein